MKKNIKKLWALEMLLQQAKYSKHTDAILLLSEKKPNIQAKVIEILKNTIPETEETSETDKKAIEVIKKSIATFAEYVFNESISILVNDKK